MRTTQTLYCLGITVSLLYGHIAAAQSRACCDNGQGEGEQWNSSLSMKDRNRDCEEEISVTAKACVDAYFGRCEGTQGSRFCREDGANEYPRYYAVQEEGPICRDPGSLTFYASKGGSNPASQTVSLSNEVWRIHEIDYDMPWTASTNQGWLGVSPTSDTLGGSTAQTLTVSVNISGLSQGVYNGTITIASSKVSSLPELHGAMTVSVQLSVFGASISGPSQLDPYEEGTWTATATGGVTPYHYQWYYRYPITLMGEMAASPRPRKPPPGYWHTAGSDSCQITRSDDEDFQLKCEVTDAKPATVTSNILNVIVGGDKSIAKRDDVALLQSPDHTHSVTDFIGATPNPFNPSTNLHFTLADPANVEMKVFDLLGREVADLIRGHRPAGRHTVQWNAAYLSAGIYLVHFTATGDEGRTRVTVMKKVLLIK